MPHLRLLACGGGGLEPDPCVEQVVEALALRRPCVTVDVGEPGARHGQTPVGLWSSSVEHECPVGM